MNKLKKIKHTLILVIVTLLFSCSKPDQKHIGEWTGTDKGETGNLILNESNSAAFVIGNQVLGGDNFEMNGVKASLEYEIDYSKNPIWLDLVAYEKEKKKEKGRLKGIIRFLTDTKMEYRLSFDPSGDRFIKFDSEDKENTIVLDKVIK